MTMSVDENDGMARLRRAFASYLKGEMPSRLELEGAPLLENWRASVMHVNRTSDPLHLILVLAGNVTGHPHLADNQTIWTSQLVWLDRHRQWARTWNRVYRLGKPADDATDAENEVW
jgi:hypothetical protein